jgi:hypothetical protein
MAKPQTKKRSHRIPLGPQRKNSFTRFDDDGTTLVREYNDEISITDAGHGVKKHMGHRDILVRSDYDVKSPSR